MTRQTDNTRGIFTAEVLANERLCREHYRIRLAVAGMGPSMPGQFVQVLCRPLDAPPAGRRVEWKSGQWPRLDQPELTDREAMLRRPVSLAGRGELGDGRDELMLIYRTIGAGTHWLGRVEAGSCVSLLGPLGNAFTIRPDKARAILVGGGVGIPPMLYLAEALVAAGRDVIAFCGARSGDLLPLKLDPAAVSPEGRPGPAAVEFARMGVDSVIATDDGSVGWGQTVTEALRNYLNSHLPPESELVVYSCGPEPMMRSLAELCLSRGYECQLALERYMGCGMGTCQSCVVKVRDPSPQGWQYKLCCRDGPVFDAARLLW